MPALIRRTYNVHGEHDFLILSREVNMNELEKDDKEISLEDWMQYMHSLQITHVNSCVCPMCLDERFFPGGDDDA